MSAVLSLAQDTHCKCDIVCVPMTSAAMQISHYGKKKNALTDKEIRSYCNSAPGCLFCTMSEIRKFREEIG